MKVERDDLLNGDLTSKVNEDIDPSIKQNFQTFKFYNSIRFTNKTTFYTKWKEAGLLTYMRIELIKDQEKEYCIVSLYNAIKNQTLYSDVYNIR